MESRVTVFTSGRRGGCLRLFKSFYYAMSIYIHGVIDLGGRSSRFKNYLLSVLISIFIRENVRS